MFKFLRGFKYNVSEEDIGKLVELIDCLLRDRGKQYTLLGFVEFDSGLLWELEWTNPNAAYNQKRVWASTENIKLVRI